MSNFPTRPAEISQELYDLCLKVTARRPRIVIDHILRHGQVTTDELRDIHGYGHPPRAKRDVLEQGIPIDRFSVRSLQSGRMIAAYRLGDTLQIRRGRIGGRKAFAKSFKKALVDTYGARSTITREPLEERYLQVDHRIPYEVAGEADTLEIADYMLLDASEQRAKSWSCEGCENSLFLKEPATCRTCFWAFPEKYEHVAMIQEKRLQIVWRADQADDYATMATQAEAARLSPQEFIKLTLRNLLPSE